MVEVGLFPAIEVCDANFLGWPHIASPKDIAEELGAKSHEDFDADERAAWEKVGDKPAQ
jgi:hypothetical protein